MKLSITDLSPYLAICADVLNPQKAGVLGDRQAESLGISLNKEGAVRRVWQELPAKYIYIFKAFLDYYTDATNVSDGVVTNYVKDPVVGDAHNGKIVVPGTYRNAFTIVRPMADDKYMLIQELRLGFLETLGDDGVVDWGEARVEQIDWLHGDSGANADHNYVTVVWKGVSPSHVHDIVKYLDGLSPDYWTPTVNGNALGSFRRLMVRQQEESDGSSSVRVMLANSRLTFEAYANWATARQSKLIYHFNVPSDMVNAVVEAEKVVGASVRISPPDNRGLHDVVIDVSDVEEELAISGRAAISCSAITYVSIYLGLSNETADDVVDALTHEDGVSFEVRYNPREDGLWDITIYRTVTAHRPIPEYVSEDSDGRVIKVKQDLGYKGAVPVVAASTGQIKRLEVNVRPDCSKDIVETTIESQPQYGEDNRATVKYKSEGTISTNVENPAPFTPPATSGVTRVYQKRPNQDGTFDIVQRDDIAPHLTGEVIRGTVKYQSVGVAERNAHEPLERPTPEVGETVSYESRENDDGTFDSSARIDEAPELEGETRRLTAKSASTGQINKNLRSIPLPPDTPGIGVTTTWERRENDDGTWDEVVRNDEAPPLDGENKRATVTGGESVGVVKRNAKEKGTHGKASVGTIVNWDARENDDGTWDTVERLDVSPVLTNEEHVRSPSREVVGVGVRNDRREPDVPDTPESGRVTFRKSQNEDGTWDHMTLTETPVGGLSVGGGSKSKCFDLGTDVAYAGVSKDAKESYKSSALSGIPDNAIIVWNERENDDGTWDFSYRYQMAPPLRGVAKTMRAKGGVVESIKKGVSASDLDSSESVATGVTKSIRQEQNPDCSWDEFVREETAPSLSGSVIVERADQIVSTSRKINSPSPEESPVSGTGLIEQVSNDENPDGTWNTTRISSLAVKQEYRGEYSTDNRTVNILVFRNWTKLEVDEEVSGLDAANNNNVSATPNEFDLYDGQITSVTPPASGGSGGTDADDYTNYSYTVDGQTVRVKITSFATRAADHAKLTNVSSKSPLIAEAAGVFYIGNGRFKAVAITKVPAPPA